jgi:hypothetical protein
MRLFVLLLLYLFGPSIEIFGIFGYLIMPQTLKPLLFGPVTEIFGVFRLLLSKLLSERALWGALMRVFLGFLGIFCGAGCK